MFNVITVIMITNGVNISIIVKHKIFRLDGEAFEI